MIQISPQMHILLAVEPLSFRKGIDSLAAVCRQTLQADPFNGHIFVFRNKAATAIKILNVRWSRFLALSKKVIQRTFQVVASQLRHEIKIFSRS